MIIMFYAPWCGFCKRMKPDYQQAATEIKGSGILAALDVTRPENNIISRKYNITGFPTLLYFENGVMKYPYPGDNKKDALVSFEREPQSGAVLREAFLFVCVGFAYLTLLNFSCNSPCCAILFKCSQMSFLGHISVFSRSFLGHFSVISRSFVCMYFKRTFKNP